MRSSVAAARLLGKFVEATYGHGNGARIYKVHVPPRRHRQSPPLVVMLHGCDQDPDDFAAGTQMNPLCDDRDCYVVYPAQAQAANPARCWNWFNAADQLRGHGEPAIIAGITRQVMHSYRIDPHRVFIAGLSAGASMSIIMAATYPDLYAAVAAHSGVPYRAATNVLSAFGAMRNGVSAVQPLGCAGIPIIVFHGEDDHTVDPRNGRQIISQWCASRPETAPEVSSAEETGTANGRGYVRTQLHDTRGKLFAEQWMVSRLGHAWSGGSPQGSYADAHGPNASQQILRFFLDREQHGRLGLFDRLVRKIRSR